MKYLYLSLALAAAIFTSTARAETINCTEITAIPMAITVQGVYCLKGNLATSLATSSMIDIQTNNVTIDLNGFKLGGLAAGAGTISTGIHALNRKNITIRNGSIRGFRLGIFFNQTVANASSGHLIEDMLLDGNRIFGISVRGSGMIVRRNRVVNTGSSSIGPNAFGIDISSARNSVVADNLISGTSETGDAHGIHIGASALIEVRGNTVLDTKGVGTKRGIVVVTSTDITVIGNRVLNAAGSGTAGITDLSSSTGVNCIDNTVAGFATALTGCDFMAGNNTPP